MQTDDKNAVDLIFTTIVQENVTTVSAPAYFWIHVFARN